MTYLSGVRFIGLFYCGMLILSGIKATVVASLLSNEADEIDEDYQHILKMHSELHAAGSIGIVSFQEVL